MKQKFFAFAFIAALTSFSFVACSDDDDDDDNTKSAFDIHAVDLGLPSGNLWSDVNLGANAPEDYGDYFAWGAIKPFDKYDSETYNAEVDVHNIPKDFSGDAKFDAATSILGGKWKTPSYADISELDDNTEKEWTEINGVKGLKFTAANGNSIFIPAAGFKSDDTVGKATFSGYLWTSNLDPGYEGVGVSNIVNTGGVGGGGNYGYLGYSIRPVRK